MRLPVLARIALVTLAVGLTAGCAAVLGFDDTTLRAEGDEGGVTADGAVTDEGGPRSDGGLSRLTVKPASPVVRRGASAEITVEITRGSDVTGTVTARLSDLPSGVTATTAALAPTATTATLKLTASANATLGPTTIRLNADGTSLPAAEIPLLVADPAGALDLSFDSDGFVIDSSKATGGTFYTVGVLGDQRVVAGGGGTATAGWMMRRFASNGAPDTAFNALASAMGTAPVNGEARAFAVDASGNIVFVGSSTQPPAAQQQLTLVRLKPTGALDTTFASGVIRPLIGEAPGGSVGLAVAIQADGAIVVVGSRRDVLNNESGVIARFKPNGTRDAAFNGGASVAITGTRFVGLSLEGGSVLAAGSTTQGPLPSYFLTRRTATGANDATFGNAGTAAFGNTYRANAFAPLADGSSALVGDVQVGAAGYTAGVANAKGSGVFARGYGNAPGAGFFGIAVQSDSRIIAAGHTAPNGEARVGRILPDGNPDTSFGKGGTAILEPAGSPAVDVTLFGAALQADGRILVCGNRSNAGAILYRLWP
jgi:uncharacterized delta-60 repeat protein